MSKRTATALAFILVAGLLAGIGPTAAATVEQRVQRDFPLLSSAIDEDPGATMIAKRASIESNEPFISLRLSATEQGIDVLRSSSPGFERQTLVIDRPDPGVGFEYAVHNTRELGEIITDAAGVHFFSEDMRTAVAVERPLVVDSTGRPSRGTWRVVRRSPTPLLALRIDDRNLRYPIALTFTTGHGKTSGLRPRVTATGGSISGIVRDSTNTGIANAAVYVFDSGGGFVNYGFTNASGAYLVDELSTASYRVVVLAQNYEYQLYNGFACPDLSCNIAAGTAVNVTNGVNTPNINFTMVSNVGQIAGHVFGSGNVPLGDVLLVAYDSSSVAQGFATTDPVTGEYDLAVPTGGSFFVRTFNTVNPGYVDQLYSGIDCTSCNVTSGTPIVVALGGIARNINFTLSLAGGRIAGHVKDGTTGAPLPFRRVNIYNAAGAPVSYGDVDENGNYISFQALTPGNYFAHVSAAGYVSQLYKNIPCNTCPVTSGTPIVVTSNATTGNIDFSLSNLVTRASGRVLTSTGDPLGGALVHFYSGRSLVTTGATDSTGAYSAILPDGGTYFARTQNRQGAGYVDQVYSAIECSGCPLTQGTPITVEAGGSVSNINFALAQGGGGISGTIRDALTGAVLPGTGIAQVFGSSGEFATYGFTNAAGQYSLIDGLTTGDYFVVGGAFGYFNQLYKDIACGNSCNVTAGTPVAVTRGQTTPNIDFNLGSATARLRGQVRASGQPRAGVFVFIYDESGTRVSAATSDSTGAYEAQVSISGTYFAVADSAGVPQFADQLYSHLPCIDCDPTTGTAIDATVGAVTNNIDFDLQPASCTALSLSPDSLPIATVGELFGATITSDNGAAPFTFAVTAGALPNGLTLASTGELTGTPTAAGSYTFTISGTDSIGCTGSVSYTLSVVGGPTTTTLTASQTTAVYGSTITFTASVDPAAATGTVSFYDGATLLATSTLNSGTATASTSTLVAGTHNISAVYGGSATYASSTSATVVVTILKATPVFSNLSAPVIVIGTPSTAIGGTIAFGSLVPTGSVIITVNGVAQSAAILANGTFSSTFLTSGVGIGPHPIAFSYAGDANFNSATGASTLIVTYGITGGSDAGPANSGSTIPFNVKIVNAFGTNLSSSSIAVTAYGVQLVGTTTWLPAPAPGNQGADFDFQNSSGGQYRFNLKTTGLAAGDYVLGFTVAGDPIIHTVPFTIR